MNDVLTNGTEIKSRIISEIERANKNIFIAMAFFTDRDIASAIIEAKNRGVFIDVILSSNANNEVVKEMFLNANINIHAFETGDERGMMHHKFCLIDNTITINGSYNYSFNASKNNVENIHISDDIKIYKQFLQEFERLKYNIEHQININTNTNNMITDNNRETEIKVIRTSFYDKLKNSIYAITDIDTDEYEKKGYELSERSSGNIEIFKSNYLQIKQEIKSYATNDSLDSKKNKILADIKSILEDENAGINKDKEQEINSINEKNKIEVKQVNEKISEKNIEKSICERGDENTGEKGLLQINKEIEKTNLDIKDLDNSFIVKKFWNGGTILSILGLLILVFILSLVFASAFYKMIYEGDVIRESLEAGLTPKVPQAVDLNAYLKVFKTQGTVGGIFALLFFLLPLFLSNLGSFFKINKWLKSILFWSGILIFDIVVSAVVAINIDEIKSLLVGQKSTLQMWEVIKYGEFYKVLMVGALPLIITHFVVDFLLKSYRKSRLEIVDAEKHKQMKMLEKELLELKYQKDLISKTLDEIKDFIKQKNEEKQNLEIQLFENQKKIEDKFNEKLHVILNIYKDFETKIISGKIFTDEILNSVISSYRKGYIDYLPELYAQKEVEKRVKEIEQIN